MINYKYNLYYSIVFLPLISRILFPLKRIKDQMTVSMIITDPQIIATIILFIFGFLVIILCDKKLLYKIFKIPFLFYAIFIIIALLSSFNSGNRLLTIWKSFEVVSLLIWSLGTLAIVKNEHDLLSIINIYIFMLCILLMGVSLNLILYPQESWLAERHIDRLSSTMIGPNTIGAISGILCGIFAINILNKKYQYIVLFLIAFCFNYFSHSRTGYIVLLANMIYMFVLIVFIYRSFINLSLLSVIILFIIGIFQIEQIKSVLYYSFTRGDKISKIYSLTGRTKVWWYGLDIAGKNNFMGSGYGFYDSNIINIGGTHFHNMFMEILVTLGIIGVAICVVIFMYLCFKIYLISIMDVFNRRRNIVNNYASCILLSVMLLQITSSGAAYYSIDMISIFVLLLISYYANNDKYAILEEYSKISDKV